MRMGSGPVYPIFKCRDGYVRLIVLSPAQWREMRAWLGEPEYLQDEEYDSFPGRFAIAEAIRTTLNPNPADITEVMGDIGALLDASITGATVREKGPPPLDLSKIDFEALARRFKDSKRKNTDLEVLKAAIRAQLEKLIRLLRLCRDC